MDLFVVNRAEDIKTNDQDEKGNLDKVLQRIEQNKSKRAKNKQKKAEIQQIILKKKERLQRKHEIKAQYVPVVDNKEQFIDDSIPKLITEDELNNIHKEPEQDKKSKKKKSNITEEIEGFAILGDDKFDKKSKVKRVLPKWLSNPVVISTNLQKVQTKVTDIKALDKSLVKLLKSNNIEHFFPVQAAVIPYILETNNHVDILFPRDICVSAPTGSGKTLAFVLPVVQALKKYTVKMIRALVILPTQDLAVQVLRCFKTYTQNTSLEVCLITGKNSFVQEQRSIVVESEALGYVSRVDILICTAGRLVDHLKMTKGFNLQHLEFLIIDEADRVLDSVQNDWLYHLEKHIYNNETAAQKGKFLNLATLQKSRPPQKLLFSATLSQDPEKLQKLSLFEPKLFTSVVEKTDSTISNETVDEQTFIGKYTTPTELIEKYIVCTMDLKPLVLYEFIKTEKLTKTIVFTHSVDSAHRLALLLKSLFKESLKVEEISSELHGNNRNELIKKFADNKVDILVCTDSLARGIDLPGVQCVISYSAPKFIKTYIHRAGRTARAGQEGLAVTILHQTQLSKFKTLLEQAGKSNVNEIVVPETELETLGEQYTEALNQLKSVVEEEEKAELRKQKIEKSKSKKRKWNASDTK